MVYEVYDNVYWNTCIPDSVPLTLVADVDFDVHLDFKELIEVEESLLIVVALFAIGLDEVVPDLDVL